MYLQAGQHSAHPSDLILMFIASSPSSFANMKLGMISIYCYSTESHSLALLTRWMQEVKKKPKNYQRRGIIWVGVDGRWEIGAWPSVESLIQRRGPQCRSKYREPPGFLLPFILCPLHLLLFSLCATTCFILTADSRASFLCHRPAYHLP